MVLKLDEQRLSNDQPDKLQEVLPARGGGNRTLSRLNFFRLGMLGGFTILGWRLWDLQQPLQPDMTSTRTDQARQLIDNTRYITSKAPRGILYDRNGKRLVTNAATYSVTITANYLPDPDKTTTAEEEKAVLQQRQAVYDNLARFLGMSYFVGIVPEQVNGLKDKKGVFTNPIRNDVLNVLEVVTGISALDWDKRLVKLAEQGRDKSLLVVNEKEPIPVERFDTYKYLRDLPTKFGRPKANSGMLFLSEAERKMLEARFFIPAYQPVEVWPTLSRDDAMLLTEKRLDLPGVDVRTSYVRDYAEPRLYSHILGYTGRFNSQEVLDKANKEAKGDFAENAPTDDPSNKIPTYEIDDKIGVAGIEAWMEPVLRGRKGAVEITVNSSGNILKVEKTGKQAQAGNSVILSIDDRLQDHVYKSLEKYINLANSQKNAKAREGAAVVMDVNTGEVLAIVAFPFYNNNLYNKPYKDWTEAEKKEMDDADKAVEVNRAISARFAPGSTFKLITAAAALQERKITLRDTFNCNKVIRIPTNKGVEPSQPFKCWGTHGSLNIVGAIENSCDIFFYNAGVPAEVNDLFGPNRYYNPGSKDPVYFRGVGINPLDGYMELFNIGKKTGIELPLEYHGILPGPQTRQGRWSIGDTMTTSIGQGDLEMTPLQLCMITAAFANGGKLLQPKLVRQVKDANGKDIIPFEPKLIRDVTKTAVKWNIPDLSSKDSNQRIDAEFRVDSWVMDVVREGMLAVTGIRGTAYSEMYNKTGRLQVAGKTGTAEYGEVIEKDKKLPDGSVTDVRASRAWFTAFAPYDKPQVAVTVLIASDSAALEGSTYAVPAAREILEFIFPDLTKAKP